MLEVHNLAKRYGEVLALRELTVRVEEGECLVLLGRNGAGKTTALRCMAGVLVPSAGTVRVDGIDAADDPAGVRALVGLMPEVPGLYERMSARAYLDHFGAIYDLEPALRRRRIDELLDIFELTDAGDRWLGTFSKGMRQKVALIRATLHRPRLVLADEPTSALDPDSARRAWDYLKDLQKEGCALVICTHSMEEAEHLAQPVKSSDFAGHSGAIGIMSAGRALAIGSMVELRRQSGLKTRQEVRELPTLQDIYLAIVGNHVGEQSVTLPGSDADSRGWTAGAKERVARRGAQTLWGPRAVDRGGSEEAPGPVTPASAPPGFPAKSEISPGGMAPGRPDREDARSIGSGTLQ